MFQKDQSNALKIKKRVMKKIRAMILPRYDRTSHINLTTVRKIQDCARIGHDDYALLRFDLASTLPDSTNFRYHKSVFPLSGKSWNKRIRKLPSESGNYQTNQDCCMTFVRKKCAIVAIDSHDVILCHIFRM